MEGSVFEHLAELQHVNLKSNECIDRIFEIEDGMRDLSKTVNATCGFDKNQTQIACEEISPMDASGTWHLACKIKSYTPIRDITYTVSDPFNAGVDTIDFTDNRNIEFLPILLHQAFPSIRFYRAARCAIKEISKKNFENLDLRKVYLQDNQLYAVLSDTFEGLDNLFELDLSKFKI